MTLEECMEKHTERDLIRWLSWFDMQLERPRREDYYLMQIACEVRRVLSSKPNQIHLDDFQLKFKSSVPPSKPQPTAPSDKPPFSQEELQKKKSVWGAMLGIKIPRQ